MQVAPDAARGKDFRVSAFMSNSSTFNSLEEQAQQSGEQAQQTVQAGIQSASDSAQQVLSGYGAQDVQPLGPYLGLAAIFNLSFAGFLLVSRQAKRPLPEQLTVRDMALLGIATYKMSRLLSRDQVTAFLRAPFVKYKSAGLTSEVEEEPRGTGWQRALGNLLTCPYCVGQWVVAGFAYSLVFAPRTTRFVEGVLSAYALSDFLGLAYEKSERLAQS